METTKTDSKILEVRENTPSTLAVLLETVDSPSGILLDTQKLGEGRKYLQIDRSVVVETYGPLENAGTEFVALYNPKEQEPFYTTK